MAVMPKHSTVPATGLPSLRVKLAPVIVEHLTSSLKVAVITVSVRTLVAPPDGLVEFTRGPLGVAVVVKFHVWSAAMGSPALFSTAVVTVAVYTVPGVSREDGVNSALVPAQVTEPATGVPPSARVKLAEVMVEHLISSLKVAVMVVSVKTPVAPLTGLVALTWGPPGVGVVVNVHTWSAAIGSPDRFSTAEVTVVVYTVLGDRSDDGVKSAEVP